MLAFCNINGIAGLLFTLRAEHMNTWPSEVCFPGGKKEASGADMFETAKREAQQEVQGIFSNGYYTIGAPRCNCAKIKSFAQDEMAVTPGVACVGNDVNLRPSKEEVGEAFVMDSDR
jgi:coenzyme A diphosphatase NUDT7